jgi:hypothetical protein
MRVRTLDSTLEYDAIAPFLISSARKRTKALMTSGVRGRAKFIASLAHFRGFDPQMTKQIPASSSSTEILSELEHLGALEECYLLSEDPDLDGCTMPLPEGMNRIFGSGMGTILIAKPGRLGYFEGESRIRFILGRN